jgi:hypothetical protein
MNNEKLNQIKNSIEIFIKSIKENVKFNIITFNSNIQNLFNKSKYLTQECLKEYYEFMNNLNQTE